MAKKAEKGTDLIDSRKLDHIKICLTKDVQFRAKKTGLEKYDFVQSALPDLDFSEVDTELEFFGKKLKAPLIITAITGGVDASLKINTELAIACQEEGIAMGVGSQRPMIEDPAKAASYQVRDVAPDVFLCGNVGAFQLKEYAEKKELERVLVAVDKIGADALFVHLNALHELVQPEGDEQWRGCLEAIAELCSQAPFPVFAKEVGCGISGSTAKQLVEVGVKAIDVAGAGGTSWTAIELYRKGAETAETFWDWGIPTAEALEECVKAVDVPIIASGGIRNGLDAAKTIRLGATLSGAAVPFLKAQSSGGAEAVRHLISRWKHELKTAMFLTGSDNLEKFKTARMVERSA